MLYFNHPAVHMIFFIALCLIKHQRYRRSQFWLFPVLLYVLNHNTHSWYEINLSRCEEYTLSIPIIRNSDYSDFPPVFVYFLSPSGSPGDESFIKGHSPGNKWGLPGLLRNAQWQAKRSRELHPCHYGSPDAIISEQVLRYYRTAQGR